MSIDCILTTLMMMTLYILEASNRMKHIVWSRGPVVSSKKPGGLAKTL